MNMAPKAVGERSEGQVLAAFLKAGLVVCQPFGDNQRYDMVIDDNGHFIRVQCKTGLMTNGAIRFKCCSSNWNSGARRGYRGEADVFAVYVPDLDKVYIVPVDQVSLDAMLRLEPSKNGQKKGVRMAVDYEFHGSVTQR
jgi:hypothetical protein